MRQGDIKLSKETKTFELCDFCYYLRTPCALSYLLAGRECPRWKAVSSDSEQNLCNFLLSSMEMVGHLLIIFESAHQQHFSRVITNWKWKLGSNLRQISLNWNQLQSGPLLFSSITRKRTNYDRNGKSESVKVKVWKWETGKPYSWWGGSSSHGCPEGTDLCERSDFVSLFISCIHCIFVSYMVWLRACNLRTETDQIPLLCRPLWCRSWENGL